MKSRFNEHICKIGNKNYFVQDRSKKLRLPKNNFFNINQGDGTVYMIGVNL